MATAYNDPVGDAGREATSLEASAALTAFLNACNPTAQRSACADALLARFGTLSGVLAAHPRALRTVDLMDDSTAVAVSAAGELIHASLRLDLRSRPILRNGDALIGYLRLMLAHERREILRVLHLDSALHLLSDDLLGVGSLNAASVPCREIVRRALELGSGALVLVHNHPSGESKPSPQDVAVTRRLVEISKELDLVLYDHIIIGGANWTSFRAEGLM